MSKSKGGKRCSRCQWWTADKADDKWGTCEPPTPPWCDDSHAHVEFDCDYAVDCPCYKARTVALAVEKDLDEEWEG